MYDCIGKYGIQVFTSIDKNADCVGVLIRSSTSNEHLLDNFTNKLMNRLLDLEITIIESGKELVSGFSCQHFQISFGTNVNLKELKRIVLSESNTLLVDLATKDNEVIASVVQAPASDECVSSADK